MQTIGVTAAGGWATERRDLVRGVSGGMLFGIPVLFTMEVWEIGGSADASHALAVLGVTAAVLFALNRTAGFRSTKDTRIVDAAADTVEAVAIGLVSVTLVLVVLRELTGSTSVGVGLGKVVYEALPFCLGVGLARHFLGGSGDGDGGREVDGEEGLDPTVADVGVTALGAVIIALNVAPTEEVKVLIAAMGPVWLVAMVAVSLAVSYGIVFAAGFTGEDRRRASAGSLQQPVAETIFCYLVAIGVAALMLLVFRRIDGPWDETLARVVVLGLPATVGGAAGRLAL